MFICIFFSVNCLLASLANFYLTFLLPFYIVALCIFWLLICALLTMLFKLNFKANEKFYCSLIFGKLGLVKQYNDASIEEFQVPFCLVCLPLPKSIKPGSQMILK